MMMFACSDCTCSKFACHLSMQLYDVSYVFVLIELQALSLLPSHFFCGLIFTEIYMQVFYSDEIVFLCPGVVCTALQ